MQKNRLSLVGLPLIPTYSIISYGIIFNLRLYLFTLTFSGSQLGRKTRATRSSELSSEGMNSNIPAKNRILMFRPTSLHFTQRDFSKSVEMCFSSDTSRNFKLNIQIFWGVTQYKLINI